MKFNEENRTTVSVASEEQSRTVAELWAWARREHYSSASHSGQARAASCDNNHVQNTGGGAINELRPRISKRCIKLLDRDSNCSMQ